MQRTGAGGNSPYMKGEGSRPDDHALVEHREFVERLARRLVFDRHLADDLVQETLLAAMRNPPREKRALRGWLARVVRNLAYRTLRTRERRRRRERRAARPEAVPGAGDLVARLTWHRKVVDTVLALPEPYRATLLQRFYEDLAPKEIAEKQGVPGATVRSRLKRGLALMRDRLDAEHGGDRRAWTLGLLPLLFPSQPAAAAVTGGAIVGVAAMSVQKKVMVAVALMLALVGTFLTGRHVLQSGDEEPTTRTTARTAPVAEMPETADAAPTAPSDAAKAALVVLVRDGFDAPIPGAKVEVLETVSYPELGPWLPNDLAERRWFARSRAEVVRATSYADADGRAVLRGTPVRNVYVRASYEGYGTRSYWVWNRPEGALTLTLGRGYPLRGRVVDAEGRPIPGALVLAGDAVPQGNLGAGEVPARAVTDAEGRYGFDGLPGFDRCLWAAFPHGTAIYVATIRFPAVETFDIRLERGAPLTGTITDDDTGAPLAGVVVTVHERGLPVRFYGHARTDANGRYRIGTLPAGFVGAMILEKPGWAQVYESLGEGVDTSQPAVIDGRMYRAGAIHGRVLGPDGPIEGAGVASMLRAGAGSLVVRNATTDAAGWFRLADLPEGRHVVGVIKPGYRAEVQLRSPFLAFEREDHPALVAVARGADVEHDLRMTRGKVVVEGVVLGPDGAGLAGAHVGAPGASAKTGDDGAFRLEGVQRQPQGTTAVWVKAEGYVLAGEKPRVPDGVNHVRDLRIELKVAPPPDIVAGTAHDETGAVVSDAVVQVRTLPLRVSGAVPQDYVWRHAKRVRADASGRFETEMPPEAEGLLVRGVAPGRPPSKTVTVVREAGPQRQDVELVFEAGCALTGTSLPGAYLSVREELKDMDKYRAALAGNAAPTIDAVADADGMFRIEHLPAGRWEVVARLRGHADASGIVHLPQTRALRLVPEPHVAIGGELVFDDGAPVVGAKLYAYELDEDGSTRPGQGVHYGVTSGPGGKWRIDGLRPGRFKLTVRGNEEANLIRYEDKSVRGGQTDLRVVVKRGLSVSGTVVDAAGKGVPEIYLHIARDEGKVRRLYGSATSGRDGAFVIAGVPPGLNELTLRKGELRLTLKEIPAGARDLKVTFDPTRDDLGRRDLHGLAGVLVDEDGRPVVGRRIWLKGLSPLDYKTQTTTDAKGRFAFAQLPEGRYPLELERPRDDWMNKVPYLTELGTFAAGSTDLVVTARRGLSIRGIVTDEHGTPQPGVYVKARAGKDKAWMKTGPDGRFELRGLPEGARALVRTLRNGLVDDIRRDVAVGTADLRLVVKPGLRATGRALDAAGRPLADTAVRVVLIEDEQRAGYARTDDEGRFELAGLVPGRYRVSVAPEGKGYVECGELAAGDTGVELRLR